LSDNHREFKKIFLCKYLVETLYLGKYRELERIARGGEAEVFRVQHEDSIYALKKFLDGTMRHDDIAHAREGATLEAAFLCKAYNDGREDVPRVVEVGQHGIYPVIVMEEITGVTLETYIADTHFLPTEEEGLDIAKQLGSTLNYAHNDASSEPFINRDIKPQNVMRREDGTFVMLDWSGSKPGGGHTMTNTQFGSFLYAAPELFEGKTVTPATDVYSFGKLLQHYFVPHAFISKDGNVTRKDLQGSNLSRSIQYALTKATHPDPKQRYQTIDDFLVGLEHETSLVRVRDERKIQMPKKWLMGNTLVASIGFAMYGFGRDSAWMTVVGNILAMAGVTGMAVPIMTGLRYKLGGVERDEIEGRKSNSSSLPEVRNKEHPITYPSRYDWPDSQNLFDEDPNWPPGPAN